MGLGYLLNIKYVGGFIAVASIATVTTLVAINQFGGSSPSPTLDIIANTPIPTQTLLPTPRPIPTDTPSLTQTIVPTITPPKTYEEKPQPTDTPEPLPTNTPEPTSTPQPTSTPEPLPTFTPEPLPTNTPEPTPLPLEAKICLEVKDVNSVYTKFQQHDHYFNAIFTECNGADTVLTDVKLTYNQYINDFPVSESLELSDIAIEANGEHTIEEAFTTRESILKGILSYSRTNTQGEIITEEFEIIFYKEPIDNNGDDDNGGQGSGGGNGGGGSGGGNGGGGPEGGGSKGG